MAKLPYSSYKRTRRDQFVQQLAHQQHKLEKEIVRDVEAHVLRRVPWHKRLWRKLVGLFR